MQPDRRPRWLAAFCSRLAMLAGVLVVGGLLSVALVRLAPGFGTDERTLDPRLSESSIQAIRGERAEGSHLAAYYGSYLRRLLKGDLGTSVSLGRPVRELVIQRFGVTAGSAAGGLGLAWAAALALALGLDLLRRRGADAAASAAAGALLCAPASVVALACAYLGGTPALALGTILFPRIFRYLVQILREASHAGHVLAAHAFGQGRLRVFLLHTAWPAMPEWMALAGVSVSMAAGAAIPVEVLCDSPGLGQMAWQAALSRDLPVITAVTLLITGVTAAANCAAEAFRTMKEGEV